MTYWQHWQRGCLMSISIGVAVVAAGVIGGLLSALAFIPLELLWSRPDWSTLEDHYLPLAAIIAVILLTPKFLSDMVDQKILPPEWPPKKRN